MRQRGKNFIPFSYFYLHSVPVDPVSSIATILSLGVKKIKLFNGDDYKREREELTQKKAEDNNFECNVSA